jgi:hypothetical protein
MQYMCLKRTVSFLSSELCSMFHLYVNDGARDREDGTCMTISRQWTREGFERRVIGIYGIGMY